MFCPKCGKEVHNESYNCNSCGAIVRDKGGFKYGLLGFLFPVAAVIIYYMLRDKEPKLCESLKIGAITMLIVGALYTFSVYSILIIGAIEQLTI